MKTAHFLRSDATASQDLSVAALSYTTSFGRKFKLEQVIFKFVNSSNVRVPVTETITITLDAAQGVAFDVQLHRRTLVGQTDYVWRPQGEVNLQSGDKLKAECTNANGLGIAKVNIKSSEM